MNYNVKAPFVIALIFFVGMFYAPSVSAQETLAPKETAGCKPSSCRGAKTKFGEAKVITDMRESLIALKSTMEKSTSPVFESRSYDMHDIVGESDDESLAIIVREIKIIEKEFRAKLNQQLSSFTLPDNKAKQVSYLTDRITSLRNLL